MVVRTIERKGTYQCFFHKRDRANRTLYKTENIRKLPSGVYQDYRRRRDHRLFSSINQERELFRHTEQIQSKRPAVAPRHRGKAKSLQERISIQLSEARQQPGSAGLHADADSRPSAVLKELNELCVGTFSVFEVPTARSGFGASHDATADDCQMKWWSQKTCRVVCF